MNARRAVGFLFPITAAVATLAAAASGADFTGSWLFVAQKSRNIGMMAGVMYTSSVKQTAGLLTVQDRTVFEGKEQSRETKYDLSGATVQNTSPMGDPAQTVSHWDGPRLVTQWTSAGSIAGTTTVRTEIRWLSADGKTMSVQSAKEGRQPMVLVFERQ